MRVEVKERGNPSLFSFFMIDIDKCLKVSDIKWTDVIYYPWVKERSDPYVR